MAIKTGIEPAYKALLARRDNLLNAGLDHAYKTLAAVESEMGEMEVSALCAIADIAPIRFEERGDPIEEYLGYHGWEDRFNAVAMPIASSGDMWAVSPEVCDARDAREVAIGFLMGAAGWWDDAQYKAELKS